MADAFKAPASRILAEGVAKQTAAKAAVAGVEAKAAARVKELVTAKQAAMSATNAEYGCTATPPVPLSTTGVVTTAQQHLVLNLAKALDTKVRECTLLCSHDLFCKCHGHGHAHSHSTYFKTPFVQADLA